MRSQSARPAASPSTALRLAAKLRDLLDDGVGPVEVDVADDDLGALGGEPEGCRPPHASAAAGDEGHSAFESAHVRASPSGKAGAPAAQALY